MTDDQDQAFDDAEEAAHSGAVGLLETVFNQIGMNAGAKAVFGDPIEKNGRTVIPVAQAVIGTGGGGGSSDKTGSGEGAGGGALTRPLGYIEISDEGTVFVPLRQPWQEPGLVLAYSVLALVVLRTAVRLIRNWPAM